MEQKETATGPLDQILNRTYPSPRSDISFENTSKSLSIENTRIVAYRRVARQLPRQKQLHNGNGVAVNSKRNCVFLAVRAEML
jgi:hypothetical protein